MFEALDDQIRRKAHLLLVFALLNKPENELTLFLIVPRAVEDEEETHFLQVVFEMVVLVEKELLLHCQLDLVVVYFRFALQDTVELVDLDGVLGRIRELDYLLYHLEGVKLG